MNATTIGAFSPSGWINEDIMILILDQIFKRSNNDKSILLLDQYDAHRTNKIKDYAKLKNITVIYIPSRLTYKYQPLDVSINGILKEKLIKSHASFVENNKNDTYKHADCIRDLMTNFKLISKKTIIKPFSCLKRSHSNDDA